VVGCQHGHRKCEQTGTFGKTEIDLPKPRLKDED
jgi:hypothetical protein